MAQIFSRHANSYVLGSIILVLVLVASLLGAADRLSRSPYVTRQDTFREQPIQFSHQHHVGGIGIDCRYCHTSVEKSSFAGIPPTKTCMNCHSQIWTNAPILEPVRASFREDTPISWTRVHDLPDFVYFNHQIHVRQGVGCVTCHGDVDKMPLMYQALPLLMEWCLTCHREPEKFLRPRERVFDMSYRAPSGSTPVDYAGERYTDQLSLGLRLKKEYNISGRDHMTSCSVCHR